MANIVGDTYGGLTGSAIALGQVLSLPDLEGGTLKGDADWISDSAQGGNDTLYGGDGFGIENWIMGDAIAIIDHAAGGDDTIYGGEDVDMNRLAGDARSLWDYAIGGDDLIYGGASAQINILYGDAQFMYN